MNCVAKWRLSEAYYKVNRTTTTNIEIETGFTIILNEILSQIIFSLSNHSSMFVTTLRTWLRMLKKGNWPNSKWYSRVYCCKEWIECFDFLSLSNAFDKLSIHMKNSRPRHFVCDCQIVTDFQIELSELNIWTFSMFQYRAKAKPHRYKLIHWFC